MSSPKRSRRSSSQSISSPTFLALLFGFTLGCIVSATFLLSLQLEGTKPSNDVPILLNNPSSNEHNLKSTDAFDQQQSPRIEPSESILSGVRVLVAIAAYDFSQLPHFEEVLDAYSDLCATGAHVDVIVHATIPYPITLIDLLNTRVTCLNPSGRFDVKISLVSPTVRLHLVDEHRPLFYQNIEEYDLFIYTEDDIRVTPRTIAAYLNQTKALQAKVGFEKSLNYNVGIVRYEYNFPSNVLMDDNTRHATQNVTRVYWEHSHHFPAIPEIVDIVPDLDQEYVQMIKHHQGMFLATPDLLKAWKKKCQFDVVTDRPGRGSQPIEGTQRVWMSSQQLYSPRHCGIQQVIPIDAFGSLTCLHLPNKNYRRVGHFRNRTFATGNEQFDMGARLLTAMNLHIELRAVNLGKPRQPYTGIAMEDKIDRSVPWTRELDRKFSKKNYFEMVDRRMHDFEQYASRGGVMVVEDLSKTALMDALAS